MSSLKFKRLLLLSDTLRAGRLLRFGDQLTLITADENSVGKSTIVKCLFWAFGCEPYFDTTFKGFDAKVIVDFEVDSDHYRIRRYQDDLKIKIGNEPYRSFSKVGGDFSSYIAQILNFKARLPSRNGDSVEVPPPAYYFVPYYVDQVKSWSEAWNNFEKLQQYSNWKSTIIQYHVGILSDQYFEYSEKISEAKQELVLKRDTIRDLQSAYDVIEEQRPKSVTTINEDEFQVMTDEIASGLKKLSEDQESLLSELALNQADISSTTNQIDITRSIILELDNDYKFAVEHIVDDKFQCPLCGVVHDNDVINRGSILTDKAQAIAQLEVLEGELKKFSNKRIRLRTKIDEIRGEIRKINEKYIFKDAEDRKIELEEVIQQIASNSIQTRIEKKRAIEIFNERTLNDTVKRLKVEQKETTTENRRENIESMFRQIFQSYIDELNAEGVNVSKIKKPTSYNQIVKEGGAAEGVRAILSYYLTIYKLINTYSNEVISPLVIDTPNQHEQSAKNYEMIVEALLDEDFKNGQIIICAMDRPNIKSLKESAFVIKLDDDKIFLRSEYESLYDEFRI